MTWGQGVEDVELVEIGALLHDVHDWKYSGSETASADAASELLSAHVSVFGFFLLRFETNHRDGSISGCGRSSHRKSQSHHQRRVVQG